MLYGPFLEFVSCLLAGVKSHPIFATPSSLRANGGLPPVRKLGAFSSRRRVLVSPGMDSWALWRKKKGSVPRIVCAARSRCLFQCCLDGRPSDYTYRIRRKLSRMVLVRIGDSFIPYPGFRKTKKSPKQR